MSPPCAPMPGHQQRHFTDDRAHAGELLRIGRADDQRALPGGVPFARRLLGDQFIERRVASAEFLELEVASAGVRGAAEQENAFLRIGEPRLKRIAAHERIHGHRIGLVTLEALDRVLLGGAADVAALGVEDDRDAGVKLVDMVDDRFELGFGAARGEVGDLRLESADQIGGGVDDRGAEAVDAIRPVFEGGREFRRIGIEADAQQRIVLAPRRRRAYR
jgi:hypothetical protein